MRRLAALAKALRGTSAQTSAYTLLRPTGSMEALRSEVEAKGAMNPVLSPVSLGKRARSALLSPPPLPFPAARGWLGAPVASRARVASGILATNFPEEMPLRWYHQIL